MNTRNLHLAKKNKNDEFFTRLPDIENELKHYEKHFAGKVVYCNCDNPAWSNFPKFFTDNFDRLQLKGLLTNHLEADGKGDFRGKEALAKLEQADIVVSNPPFSLFREYIAQLVSEDQGGLFNDKADKKFLIIGNLNAIKYNTIFPFVKAGKIWAGVNNGAMKFDTPEGIKPIGMCWITNLEHGHGRPLELTRQYDPAIHKKYYNFDAINVDKIKDIPCDYMFKMGVPLTILLGYDTTQFEIIGITYGYRGMALGIENWTAEHKEQAIKQGATVRAGQAYYIEDGKFIVPYNRVIIRRKP